MTLYGHSRFLFYQGKYCSEEPVFKTEYIKPPNAELMSTSFSCILTSLHLPGGRSSTLPFTHYPLPLPRGRSPALLRRAYDITLHPNSQIPVYAILTSLHQHQDRSLNYQTFFKPFIYVFLSLFRAALRSLCLCAFVPLPGAVPDLPGDRQAAGRVDRSVPFSLIPVPEFDFGRYDRQNLDHLAESQRRGNTDMKGYQFTGYKFRTFVQVI
jgi:hypothetical protein